MAKAKSRKKRREARKRASVDAAVDVGAIDAAEADAQAPASPPRPRAKRRAAPDERPPAPWGSFPLVEITVLVGLVLLIAGFFIQGTRGITMIAVGLVIASLAGLELAVREHFAGYRSHSMLIAGTAAVATVGILFYASGLILAICLGAGLAVLIASTLALRVAFRRASGGLSYKIGGLRG